MGNEVLSKKELICEIATELNRHEKDVAEILESFERAVTASLQQGYDVELRGFGTFKKKAVKARAGRNPKTGEPIQIPAKNLAKFYSSKALDKEMN